MSKIEIITECDMECDEMVHQGDIITNVEYIEYADVIDGNIEISKINFPKVIVLTQECDSVQDYSNRKECYENVSRKSLGEDCEDHICVSPDAERGYRFSDAMKNPGFIGTDEIQTIYAPAGFRHFKIEGRSLGSAVILEFLLYYMTRPEWQLKVREEIYLDSMLDLF